MTDHASGRLNIGQVIRRSLTLIARRPASYAGIVAVPSLYFLFLAYFVAYATVSTGGAQRLPADIWRSFSGGAKVIHMIVYLGCLFVNGCAWVATIHTAAEFEAGRYIGVVQAYRRITWRSLLPLGLILIAMFAWPFSIVAVPVAAAFFIPALPFAVLDRLGPGQSVSLLKKRLGGGLPDLVGLLMAIISIVIAGEVVMLFVAISLVTALLALSIWIRPMSIFPNSFLVMLPIQWAFVALTLARGQLTASNHREEDQQP